MTWTEKKYSLFYVHEVQEEEIEREKETRRILNLYKKGRQINNRERKSMKRKKTIIISCCAGIFINIFFRRKKYCIWD